VEICDIIKQQIQKEMQRVGGELNEVMRTVQVMKEQADEQRDKEKKRNNMILCNVPEFE